jgi:N-acetylglucosaminyldiphosphoundecaprenol N-acetyl-beta-D-mannosaminyltransferase
MQTVQTVNLNTPQTVRVLGSRVHLLSAASTVDQVEHWVNVRDGCCRRVTVSGFHGLLLADKDHKIHRVLNEAELWAPDGIAPVLVARMCGYRNVQRTTGTDIMLEFFRRANQREYSSYFYGDTDATLTALSYKVRRDYPGHKIVGAFAPPFRSLAPDEDKEVVDRINAARPDVLWVALGMPKQDLWIYERLDRLNVPVAIGVGAAFAFVAGTVPRCSDWMGRMGFEWAYRFTKEPKKLWRRVLIDSSHFLLRLGLDAAGFRRSRV